MDDGGKHDVRVKLLSGSDDGTRYAKNAIHVVTKPYILAVLLSNGDVLYAGGWTGTGATASVNRFNASSNQWAAVGNMNVARYGHSVTALQNGQVLVVGGIGGVVLSSCELFDPASSKWSSTGSMNTARFLHTSTLLLDGRMLVAGGSSLSGALASVDLFNPSIGTWTVATSMSTARSSHTATLLPNGNALVAGGYSGSAYLSSVELFSPTSGGWTTVASMSTARFMHTAALLPNGFVLVAGGYNGAFLSSAELYDPSLNTWIGSTMSVARHYATMVVLSNGNALMCGGSSGLAVLSSCEIYNSQSIAWTVTASMSTARGYPSSALLQNNKVLVTGGMSSSSSTTNLSSSEVFNMPIPPPSCVFDAPSSDDLQIDLRPLADKVWSTPNSEYSVNTEHIALCGTEVSSSIAACPVGSTVCESGSAQYISFGQNPFSVWFSGDSLFYQHSTASPSCRFSTIEFVCDPEASDDTGPAHIANSADNCQQTFLWKTKLACPKKTCFPLVDGREFDLSDLMGTTHSVPNTNSTAHLALCGETVTTVPECANAGWAACQTSDGQRPLQLGAVPITYSLTAESTLLMAYSLADPFTTTIEFICDEQVGLGQPELVSIGAGNAYHFVWAGQSGCPVV